MNALAELAAAIRAGLLTDPDVLESYRRDRAAWAPAGARWLWRVRPVRKTCKRSHAGPAGIASEGASGQLWFRALGRVIRPFMVTTSSRAQRTHLTWQDDWSVSEARPKSTRHLLELQ